MSAAHYDLLLAKLREFKRRYYYNKMLRGLYLFVALFAATFLLAVMGEGFGRFSVGGRTAIFYAVAAVNLSLLVYYIAIPLAKIYELGQTISNQQAAQIIGKHFGNVQDKLLNTLQLKEKATQAADAFEASLIEASINQKIAELRPVPFIQAIDLRQNRRYGRYVLAPLAIAGILLLVWPGVLMEGTTRLMAHQREFIPEAPFAFEVVNDSLTAIRQEDFTVRVKIVPRTEVPSEVNLLVDGRELRMKPESKTEFTALIRNPQKESYRLQFAANKVSSETYNLKVLARPFLQKVDAQLVYPAHTGKANESVSSTGDLEVPQGTRITWRFHTRDAEELVVSKEGQRAEVSQAASNIFKLEQRADRTATYSISTRNKAIASRDTMRFTVKVVADAYPSIAVSQDKDSSQLKAALFSGEVADDYGFTSLNFVYRFTKRSNRNDQTGQAVAKPITIARDRLLQRFTHYWDFSELAIKAGDEIEYYFEVRDNDALNGYKASRSQTFTFHAPTLKELNEKTSENSQAMQEQMSAAMRQARELQKQLQDMRMKLINKPRMDWQDRKQLEELLQKERDLENKLQQLEKQYRNDLNEQNEFRELNPELLRKHQLLQEMLHQMFDDETRQLLEEIRKLMEEENKNKLEEKLSELKLSDKEVEKEIERMQELYKQLEFDQKLDNLLEQLDNIQQQQEELAKEAEQKNADSEAIKEKQEELEKQFDEIQKQLQELEKMNENLQQQKDMAEVKDLEKQIDQEMQEAGEQLEQKQNKKASEKQKKAAEKMKEMSEKLAQMKQDMQDKQQAEDYNALRQIMDNLLYLSFEQEKLIDELKTINQYNPQFVELSKKQQKLKGDARMIEDSLFALSKRVAELSTYINKEVSEINYRMGRTLGNLNDRNIGQARANQQYTMTAVNNLAVMLSELLKNMQENMAESQNCSGNKPCGKPKPGKGKETPDMKKMQELQQQLGEQLKQMKEGLKKGEQGTSRELSEMAARQEALRRELEKLEREMKQQGKQPGELKEIQELMDKNEEDLVNKRVTDQTLKRHEEIMVRLLNAEKAQKQQEYDDERKAEEGKDRQGKNPPLLEKYLRSREQEVELLRTVPPALSDYYRQKVKEYFQVR